MSTSSAERSVMGERLPSGSLTEADGALLAGEPSMGPAVAALGRGRPGGGARVHPPALGLARARLGAPGFAMLGTGRKRETMSLTRGRQSSGFGRCMSRRPGPTLRMCTRAGWFGRRGGSPAVQRLVARVFRVAAAFGSRLGCLFNAQDITGPSGRSDLP